MLLSTCPVGVTWHSLFVCETVGLILCVRCCKREISLRKTLNYSLCSPWSWFCRLPPKLAVCPQGVLFLPSVLPSFSRKCLELANVRVSKRRALFTVSSVGGRWRLPRRTRSHRAMKNFHTRQAWAKLLSSPWIVHVEIMRLPRHRPHAPNPLLPHPPPAARLSLLQSRQNVRAVLCVFCWRFTPYLNKSVDGWWPAE